RATQLDAKLPEVRLARARGLLAVGRAEEARDLLVPLVKEEPGFDPAWASLGRAYRKLGKYDLGLGALREAVRLRPQSFRHHIELGAFHQDFEEYVEAEKEFQRALALKPESPTAWVDLGASYLLQNKPEQAIPPLTTALRYEQRAAT